MLSPPTANIAKSPLTQSTPREWLRKSRKLARLLAVRAYRHALLAQRVAATVEHQGQPFAGSTGP